MILLFFNDGKWNKLIENFLVKFLNYVQFSFKLYILQNTCPIFDIIKRPQSTVSNTSICNIIQCEEHASEIVSATCFILCVGWGCGCVCVCVFLFLFYFVVFSEHGNSTCNVLEQLKNRKKKKKTCNYCNLYMRYHWFLYIFKLTKNNKTISLQFLYEVPWISTFKLQKLK